MEYHALNAAIDQIRLVTILPATEPVSISPLAINPDVQQEDLINCTLDHYSLQDTVSLQQIETSSPCSLAWAGPVGDAGEDTLSASITESQNESELRFNWGDFVALSYTWGDPKYRKNIILNGSRIKVQTNLESALRILRGKKPMKSDYKIWIDALCINQEDLAERSTEVKRMRLIYKLARSVIVWLGLEADDSSRAMDLIQTLSKACISGKDKSLGAALRQDPELLGRGAWLALSLLLDRPYWHRMWIIQELSMGGGKAPIFCGRKVVLWEDLFRAVYTFGKFNVDIIFSCIDRERSAAGLPDYGLNRNKIIHINDEHKYQTSTGQSKFMCLLDVGRKSEATNPRDKVYGLLGLMDASVSARLTPDYTLSTSEVYKSFAKTFITASKWLFPCHMLKIN